MDPWSTTRLVPDDPEFGMPIGNLTTPVGREAVLSCTVDHLGKYKIMGAFQEIFNKAPPRKATLLNGERRTFAFGSVKDRPWSGRKKTREETYAGVAASIVQSPIKFDT
ncbi:hypothetical protein C0J52_18929 [Blattella germanica]|nr:hypothetical protein C0J52_18929 [Blattella germanica]